MIICIIMFALPVSQFRKSPFVVFRRIVIITTQSLFARYFLQKIIAALQIGAAEKMRRVGHLSSKKRQRRVFFIIFN